MTFERKKYKEFAKKQIQGRWTVPVLITLFTGIVMFLFQVPSLFSSGISLDSLSYLLETGDVESFLYSFGAATAYRSLLANLGVALLSFIQAFVEFVFLVATLHVYLAMSRSPEPVTFGKFIEGFNQWGRAILAGLWYTLWVFLWMLLVVGVVFVASVIAAIAVTSGENSIIMTLIPFLALLSMIPLIIKLISYSQYFYLVAEFKELSVVKALTISKQITNGYKGDIFITELSFIGWNLLVGITFGILALYVTPYYTMTMTNVYHALLKNALENKIVSPETLTGHSVTEDPYAANQTEAQTSAEAAQTQQTISDESQSAEEKSEGEKPESENQ